MPLTADPASSPHASLPPVATTGALEPEIREVIGSVDELRQLLPAISDAQAADMREVAAVEYTTGALYDPAERRSDIPIIMTVGGR